MFHTTIGRQRRVWWNRTTWLVFSLLQVACSFGLRYRSSRVDACRRVFLLILLSSNAFLEWFQIGSWIQVLLWYQEDLIHNIYGWIAFLSRFPQKWLVLFSSCVCQISFHENTDLKAISDLYLLNKTKMPNILSILINYRLRQFGARSRSSLMISSVHTAAILKSWQSFFLCPSSKLIPIIVTYIDMAR